MPPGSLHLDWAYLPRRRRHPDAVAKSNPPLPRGGTDSDTSSEDGDDESSSSLAVDLAALPIVGSSWSLAVAVSVLEFSVVCPQRQAILPTTDLRSRVERGRTRTHTWIWPLPVVVDII